MKKLLQAGLVIEGAEAGASVAQIPGLLGHIGPIKSSSLRNARRFSNTLKAGRAVASYADLSKAELVFLCAPDDAFDRIIDEIVESALPLQQISFVAGATWSPSRRFKRLQDAGASVGTLLRVPGTAVYDGFLFEGDLSICRQLRRILDASRAMLFPVKSGEKALYFAAEALITTTPLAALFGAQRALRAAGISGNPLSSLTEQLTSRLLRSFRTGLRTHNTSGLASCPSEIALSYMVDLAERMPDICKLLEPQFLAVTASARKDSGQ